MVLLTIAISFASHSQAENTTINACEKAAQSTDVALKAEWQTLCQAQERAALREAYIQNARQNAAQQQELKEAQQNLLRTTFCSSKPYPYTTLCMSLGAHD